MANFTCTVCGYDGLEEPPSDWNICERCGTEFGYQDARTSHDELRSRWIAGGAHWHSPDFPPPPFWSAIEQLANVGYMVTDEEKRIITPDELASVGRISLRDKAFRVVNHIRTGNPLGIAAFTT